jgi:putative ABC transport system substrate-binding protein
MKRREFIAGLGGAAAWPLAARAQQRAMLVIAYLSGRTAESDASMLVSVRRGLADIGYAEGRNVAIEYRFADGRYDRLSGQLTDLTRRKVDVIVLAGFFVNEELVQQVRTSPTPIVFNAGGDPVSTGLVASMNRPGGNVTGVYPPKASVPCQQTDTDCGAVPEDGIDGEAFLRMLASLPLSMKT